MRMQSTESLLFARPSLVEYFIAGVRLAHLLTAMAPALILWLLGYVPIHEHDNFIAISLFLA